MRTKLVLTTAALGVVGSLGAVAQVYSVNAVGYINLSVPAAKYVLIASQLNAGGNTVAEIFPTAANGTSIYRYNPATGWSSANTFISSPIPLGWGAPTDVIRGGEALFVLGGETDATLTLVGEVPQGALTTQLNAGLNLVASQVPQAGALTADLGYTAANGDTVYQWDAAAQTYAPANTYISEPINLGWSLGDPAIKVGEGFFLQKNAAGSWTRNFSVN